MTKPNPLGPWLKRDAYVQDAVLAWMRANEGPWLYRHVTIGTELPGTAVHNALVRFLRKGFLQRYKIPIAIHLPVGGAVGQPALRGAATRQCYLYSFVNIDLPGAPEPPEVPHR